MVEKDIGERVSYLEATVDRMCGNDLPHIYEALKDIRKDIKDTQRFLIGEGIFLVLAIIGMALKVFL
jgi:hypothetical protein